MIKLRWAEANALAEQLRSCLAPVCERIEVAGSIRRREPMVRDVELLCVPQYRTDLFGEPADSLLEARVDRLLNDGTLVGRIRNGPKWKTLQVKTLQVKHGRRRLVNVDLFITTREQWGVALAIRTGPAAFSRRMVTSIDAGGLLASGLCVQGNRIWRGRTFTAGGDVDRPGEALPTPQERDVFEYLACGWIEPEERSARDTRPLATRRRKQVSV